MEASINRKRKVSSQKDEEQELVILDACVPLEVATMDKNKDPILEKLTCAD